MNQLRTMLFAFPVILLMLVSSSPALQAQLSLEEVQEIAKKRKWKPMRAPQNADYRLVQGWALDVFNEQPIADASIKLVRGEKIIRFAVTDPEGHFYFNLPPDIAQLQQLQIVVSYGGVTTVKAPLVLETDVFVMVAEVDVVLPPVRIGAQEGPRVMACPSPSPITYIPVYMWRNAGTLYRPLDEWLMMHSSEMHHNGRW